MPSRVGVLGLLGQLGLLPASWRLSLVRQWHLLALATEMLLARKDQRISTWTRSHHVYPLARARGHELILQTVRRLGGSTQALNIYLHACLARH